MKTNILECWLYQEPIQKISLIDGNSGQIVPKEYRKKLEEIRFCTTYQVKKNYAKFITLDGSVYYKRISLSRILGVNDNFVRVSKHIILNLTHVDKRFDWIYLWSGKHQFKVSKILRLDVKTWFEESIL